MEAAVSYTHLLICIGYKKKENLQGSVAADLFTAIDCGGVGGIPGVPRRNLEAVGLEMCIRDSILPLDDYLQYMPNYTKTLEVTPEINMNSRALSDGKLYVVTGAEPVGERCV